MKGADSCIQGFRVDIERLIQTKYEIIIDTHFGLQEKYGVMAYMLTQGNRFFIDDKLLDNPKSAQCYRFTLAEELAHFKLHKDIYKDSTTIDERIEQESLLTRQEKWFLETNAKALASAILMPKTVIEKRIDNLLSTVRINPAHTSSIITKLSQEFDVSIPAARRRLINLGYHKRSDLKLKD
mgnify:CR=1 FL=1